MTKFKTISCNGKMVASSGLLKILSEKDGWKQKVELWLLNGETNRNNWRYENIEEHKHLFKETPILIAYVGDKIGDGHNFDEVRNPDGTITASFMSETAERIVGYFPDSDMVVRVERADGKDWIVGTGYIWTWYAQELVAKLNRQGIEGMSVSIETLIDEMHYDGTTEVFTKYQILGTTILGDDISPAVENANIRALSALGASEVRALTLRVASKQQEQNNNPQNKKSKGVTKTVKVQELESKFKGFTVLAVEENKVALLSEKGIPYLSTAEKDGEEIIVGAKTEVKANATFVDGDNTMNVSVEAIVEKLNEQKAQLESDLAKEKEAKEGVEKALNKMQKVENARRTKAVKEALNGHFEEIKKSFGIADNSLCDDLKTDAKISEYVAMEDEEGNFCGDKAICKEVDTRCMSAILKAKEDDNKNKKFWEVVNGIKTSDDDGVESAIKNVLE